MSTKILKIVKVILGFSNLSVSKLVDAVESILGKMTGNISFPLPTPDLATVEKAKNNLRDAVAKAKKGSVADKALVPEMRRTLMLLMFPLRE